jgi:CTP synthase
MRLGDIEITIKPDTIAWKLYGKKKILERHRHRYEVNPEFIPDLEEAGMVFSGYSDSGRRMEILELHDRRFFFATQFHPEFKSKPYEPSPPFVGLVSAALKYSEGDLDG